MKSEAIVAYNYQKNPNLTTANKTQSLTGLQLALRDKPDNNRNVMAVFPVNITTPNLGAGSPTLLAIGEPGKIGISPYAGAQTSGMGL